VTAERWFLRAAERGNPDSRIDLRPSVPDGLAFTIGNHVRPLVDGRAYFAELLAAAQRLERGDLLMFTDWRGDPDERLGGSGVAGAEVARVFGAAAERGVIVKGLLWRSHWDRLQFSAAENQHLGDAIEAAGGECLRDMRVRTFGSHHQKFVVLRHPGRPELDVAYVGGIDLCHSRGDDSAHAGDPQAQRMSPAYGSRPPWHDVQVAIQGPAVGVVETVFRERWEDPSPLTRNPLHRLRDALSREDTSADGLPAQLPDPPPRGSHAVQILRTYPYRRRGYPFARQGERSVARGYCKAVSHARRLIYLEDQYLWSPQTADCFARALAEQPGLRMIVIVPREPDQGGINRLPQLYGRMRALEALQVAAGDRIAVYSPENADGTPIYVHAKACVVDDVWATVGSDNVSLRSWTHDSELSCAVVDYATSQADDPPYAMALRLRLAREHLGRADGDDADLRDPEKAFAAFAASAAALDQWYAEGRQGERPTGRLRAYRRPELSWWTRRWAGPMYHLVCDPDGRPRTLRRKHDF
jgi:phosphatidylserine/phosphatidylglycerophosphate/cardiolipin synthase-like enzyme